MMDRRGFLGAALAVTPALIVPGVFTASRFLDTLKSDEIDEFGGLHKLLAPLPYESKLLQATVTAPKGFVTDFASVPHLPIVYLAAGGKGDRAATIHDLLYTIGSAYPGSVTREAADALLREALLACGYSRILAGAFYAAVRTWGESHWSRTNVEQPPHVEEAMENIAAHLHAA